MKVKINYKRIRYEGAKPTEKEGLLESYFGSVNVYKSRCGEKEAKELIPERTWVLNIESVSEVFNIDTEELLEFVNAHGQKIEDSD